MLFHLKEQSSDNPGKLDCAFVAANTLTAETPLFVRQLH